MLKNNKWATLLSVALVTLLLAGCGGSSPKTEVAKFPVKSINLVVPYAAGGSSDLSARPIADQMAAILGQPMVVVNKPGAGGSVGASEVSRAKGDGYTLLNASIGNVTIVPVTSKINYDYKSFKAVAQMTDIPLALTVKKDSPIKTLKEFIEFAKNNPGKIRYGSPGAGNIQHVAMSDFTKRVNIEVTHMPFEGANPAVAALLGGHVEAVCTGTTEVTGHYKSGAVRVLGVTAQKRVDFMPDVPTFKEQGFEADYGIWYGILAPASTPDEVVNQLAEAFKKGSQEPKVLDAWKKLYLIPAYLGPKEFGARIQKDAETNKKVLEALGMAKK